MYKRQVIGNGIFVCQRWINKIGKHLRFYNKSHYDVLGVHKTASTNQIKTAFVEKSKKLHPDLNQDKQHSSGEFIELYKAYSTLIKPSSRRLYDAHISERRIETHNRYSEEAYNCKQYEERRNENHSRAGSGTSKSNRNAPSEEYDEIYRRFYSKHNAANDHHKSPFFILVLTTLFLSFIFHLAIIQQGLPLHQLFFFSYARYKVKKQRERCESEVLKKTEHLESVARANKSRRQGVKDVNILWDDDIKK